jgi:hypothetical protein
MSAKKRKGPWKTVRHGSVVVRVYRVKHRTTASGWALVVAYIGTDGKRKLPQFASESEATAEASLKAAQIAAGRAEGADMSRADRDELTAARTIAGSTPLLSAIDQWKKIQELTGGHGIAAAQAWAAKNSTRFERIAVNVAVKRFTAAKERAGVDVTCSYNKILPSLVQNSGEQMLDSLSARALQQWLDTRYPHPVSRNTARKRIVALWRWARKQGYLPRDVLTEAEQTEFAREEDTEIGVIGSEMFGKLLHHFAAKHPEYLAPLAVTGFCGLRRSEVHAQQWADIDLERAFVRVSKAKRNTPSRRLVPLSPAAIEWLMLCKDRSSALCDNLAIDRIRDIARDAKFDLPDNCFRHSRISHRVAQTGNVAETALESGNSPDIIFKHYRELFTKAEGEAWFDCRPTGPGQTIKMPRKGVA